MINSYITVFHQNRKIAEAQTAELRLVFVTNLMNPSEYPHKILRLDKIIAFDHELCGLLLDGCSWRQKMDQFL